jgi:pSer/pThr/pTyr-binding forkhead associated (FHA) protein
MSFKLSVRQGPRPNLVFELDKPSYVIGREAGNDLVIEDPQVSRRHAQLTQQGNSYLIEDIGSTNGTFVNGKRVTAPTLLANGDMLGLADTVIIAVQVSLPMGGEATVVSDAVYHAPPTVPAFTPPAVQPQPVSQMPVYASPPQAQPVYPSDQVQSAPPATVYAAPRSAPPQYAEPQYVPQYAPPADDYTASTPADDKRRTMLIGLGCLGLLLVVMVVAFVAWSFIDCQSFSSVFPFLFPPFSCT